MPQRSWLAKAKSIHDLGPHFLTPRGNQPWDEKREARVESKWLERLKLPLPVEPEFMPFFGSRMHDSWLTKVERTDRLLKVSLDSINADIFALGLADYLDCSPVPSVWPVDLLLHDPVYVRAARYNLTGALRYADPFEVRYGERRESDQFLYDWFFEQDGRLQWIAELNAWRKETGHCSTSKFLMVDCARATAYDGRRAALEAAYGSNAGVLWQEAINGVDVGDAPYGPWSVLTMESFLLRRTTFHGFTRNDFL